MCESEYNTNDPYLSKDALLKHLDSYGAESLIFISHISAELQQDKEIVSAFVSINGMALERVSENFKDDEEIVSTAVQNNANSLQFASKRLQQKYV